MKSVFITLFVSPLLIICLSHLVSAQCDVRAFSIRSPQAATGLSELGTFGPIIVAVGFIVFDRPEEVEKYNNYNGSYYSITEGPNPFIPVALIGSGLIIGPSLGYFYGDCPSRGLWGIALRTGIAGGSFAIASYEFDFWSANSLRRAILASVIGGGLICASAIYDIEKVDDAVDKRNERHSKSAIAVTPKYFANHEAVGLEMTIRF